MKRVSLLWLSRRGTSCFNSASYSTKTTEVNLDPHVQELIENEAVRAKHHPGALRNVNTHLPKDLQEAMLLVVGDKGKKNVYVGAESLLTFLYSRKPPMEESEEIDLAKKVRNEVTESMGVQWTSVSEEEKEYFNKVIDSKTERAMKQRKNHWKPIEFTFHKGLQYLAARSCREFVVNHQILRELKKRFEYTPKTLFDFGSGVGSVLWAASELWPNSLQEVFAVDVSPHMHKIAWEMLSLSDRKKYQKVLYQRQFLPTSSTPMYDLVVSSYSLLELPSARTRLETVLSLWNKTKDFLVLIEFGNKAGFQVISEARDFLLWGMKKSFAYSSQNGHVVSPCPHDLACPRLTSESSRSCTFSATFTNYPQKAVIKKELYSYVVLRKGPKPQGEPEWPRVIQPILRRHRHSVCRMCTPEGKLCEVFFSPAKHGKVMHQIARQSKWGDQLPISVKDIPRESMSDFEESSELDVDDSKFDDKFTDDEDNSSERHR